MKRVIDKNGDIIDGLYRASNGSLVVKDDNSYHKYIKHREELLKQKSTIERLETEVADLKQLVKSLVKDIG